MKDRVIYKFESTSKNTEIDSKNYKYDQSERELGHFSSATTGSGMLRI